MNNLSDELYSRWPIPSTFSTDPKPDISLSFTASPLTLTVLHSLSPNISPPPPLPTLSLPSFLSSSLLPSTSSAVASSLGSDLPIPSLCHITLRLLRRPKSCHVIAFFPTGENSDRVGYITLSVKDSKLSVEDDARVKVSDSKHTLCNQRIVNILVNPFWSNSSIGFLMAFTMYGVQWFSVEIGKDDKPFLDFIGCKIFKTCAIVDACWSPHLPQVSVVLLESGELFLFDLDDCAHSRVLSSRFIGKRLKVSWKDVSLLGKRGGWVACEFSWHPEILVVAHSSAVFLLDFREEECVVTCLLEIDVSVMYTSTRSDRFVALCKAGLVHSCFVVVSEHRVILLDVRKALMPLLQWSHNIPSPSYVNVFPLSQLRVHSKGHDHFKGHCIIMGSFRDCEFNLFCYGPQAAEVASKIPNHENKLCALDIPSELLLSGRECGCGSCLMRDEFWKDSLPAWIDWRQKKETVLGFDILDEDLDAELSEQGGFTLVRLMSSGKLESQRYIPSQDVAKEPVENSVCGFQDSLPFNHGEMGYRFQKRFQYQKLDYLYAYMKDDLDKVLFDKVKELRKVPCKSDYISSVDFHQSVCEKLKTHGSHRSSSSVSNVVTCTRLLSSVHEVALSKIWTQFPVDLLQLAFSYYSNILEVLLDHKKASLEFLDIPSQPQLPPFVCREPSKRSSKWSQKVRPSTAFVGPILPTPVLLTIQELRKGEAFEFSANTEIRNQCNVVIEAVNETAEVAVSLGDDRDDICNGTGSMDLVSLHKSVPKTYGSPVADAMSEDSVYYDEKFTSFICKKTEKEVSKTKPEVDGGEMFDSLSPIEFKFDSTVKLGTNQNQFMLLKRRYSKFLQNFDPYQQYLVEERSRRKRDQENGKS